MPLPTTQLIILRQRANFLAVAASGKKWVAPRVILQIGPVPDSRNLLNPSLKVFYGLTASKKTGQAVERNKARRRLRALAQEILLAHAELGRAYVLIARPSTVQCPFDELRQDIILALKKLKAWRE